MVYANQLHYANWAILLTTLYNAQGPPLEQLVFWERENYIQNKTSK